MANEEVDKDHKLKWECMWCKGVFGGHNAIKVVFQLSKEKNSDMAVSLSQHPEKYQRQ